MNRQQYLATPVVSAFVQWMEPRLCMPGTFVHGYELPRGRRWQCDSLIDAYRKYQWQRKDSAANLGELDELSRNLRGALGDGDAQAFIDAGIAVLGWGGVLAHNDKTLMKLGEQAIAEFRAAVRELQPATADTHRIAHVRRMNAGFTKVYALLIDGFPMYDGRVGAALGYLTRLFLEERGATAVPPELRFAWAPGRSDVGGNGRKRRDPSQHTLRFPQLRANVQLHTRCNLMAAWLLGSLMHADCMVDIPPERRMRALESALFMVGYELPSVA